MEEQLESMSEGGIEGQSGQRLYIVGLPLQLSEADRGRLPEYKSIEKIGGSHASTPLESVTHLLFRQLLGRKSVARQIMAVLNRNNSAGNYAHEYERPFFQVEGKGKLTPYEVDIQQNMALALEIGNYLKIDMDSDIDPRQYGFNKYKGRVLTRNFLYDVADEILHRKRE